MKYCTGVGCSISWSEDLELCYLTLCPNQTGPSPPTKLRHPAQIKPPPNPVWVKGNLDEQYVEVHSGVPGPQTTHLHKIIYYQALSDICLPQ